MCGSTRANFWLRVVRPELSGGFASRRDAEMWRCLREILGTPRAPPVAQVLSSLSLSSGGCGLTSASRVRPAAHWSSWADCLRMGKQRHPDLAATMIHEIEHGQGPSFTAVRECRGALVEAGLDVPSWVDLSETLPEPVEDPEPDAPKFGWQQRATRPLEAQFFQDSVWPYMEDPERALMRSQHGPLAPAPLTALPTSRVMRLDAQPFRFLLCRRLHLPFPLTQRTCRCGRQLDFLGHHRAACAEAGILAKRGFVLEPAQVCREAGAGVSSNVFVRDMDLAHFNAFDGRRLEVVVSPLRRDGSPRPGAANANGVALAQTQEGAPFADYVFVLR